MALFLLACERALETELRRVVLFESDPPGGQATTKSYFRAFPWFVVLRLAARRTSHIYWPSEERALKSLHETATGDFTLHRALHDGRSVFWCLRALANSTTVRAGLRIIYSFKVRRAVAVETEVVAPTAVVVAHGGGGL